MKEKLERSKSTTMTAQNLPVEETCENEVHLLLFDLFILIFSFSFYVPGVKSSSHRQWDACDIRFTVIGIRSALIVSACLNSRRKI